MTSAKDLTIAEILRDIGDLIVAEPEAALALITANKTPDLKSQKNGKRSLTSQSDPSRFDQLGLKGTPTRGTTSSSPPSTFSGNVTINSAEEDPDMERARTLLALWEVKNRGGLQENVGLERARTSVDAVEKKYRKLQEGMKREESGRKGSTEYGGGDGQSC